MSVSALFVVEAAGPQIMGLGTFADAIAVGAGGAGLRASFSAVPALEGVPAWLSGSVRGLRKADLDLQQTRWHLAHSERTRRFLREQLRDETPDVVGVLTHAIGLTARRAAGDRPLVLVADAAIWDWRAMGIWRPVRPWSRAVLAGSLALERRALRSAALTVAWSDWTRAGLLRRAPDADVVALHPGVDLERYAPAGRRSERPRPRVLFVGGRFAAKGGQDLLAALDPLLGTEIDLDLVTPQPIEERDGVRRFELGSGDDRLVELYREADLLVLPTHGDAVPWVVVEAMASGTPVVATPVGAIGELLGNGAAGSLVPVRDPAALRAGITALLGDDARRAEMAQAGRARTEERYDARRQTALLAERLAALG